MLHSAWPLYYNEPYWWKLFIFGGLYVWYCINYSLTINPLFIFCLIHIKGKATTETSSKKVTVTPKPTEKTGPTTSKKTGPTTSKPLNPKKRSIEETEKVDLGEQETPKLDDAQLKELDAQLKDMPNEEKPNIAPEKFGKFD